MRRIHISPKPLGELQPRSQKIGLKPKGLWYGLDMAWIEWCAGEMPGWLEKHVWYEVEVDITRLLILGAEAELDNFRREFGREPWTRSRSEVGIENDYIDWPAVASRWSGVEITDYDWGLRSECLWYYAWDCASGCVWDPCAVTGVRDIEPEFMPAVGGPGVS